MADGNVARLKEREWAWVVEEGEDIGSTNLHLSASHG